MGTWINRRRSILKRNIKFHRKYNKRLRRKRKNNKIRHEYDWASINNGV
jgi:hypothetical protein